MCNSFFTSIKSVSLTSKDEFHSFINDHFKQLKRVSNDTVDSNLLLFKLFHYGFDNSSLKLIADYFSDRS